MGLQTVDYIMGFSKVGIDTNTGRHCCCISQTYRMHNGTYHLVTHAAGHFVTIRKFTSPSMQDL